MKIQQKFDENLQFEIEKFINEFNKQCKLKGWNVDIHYLEVDNVDVEVVEFFNRQLTDFKKKGHKIKDVLIKLTEHTINIKKLKKILNNRNKWDLLDELKNNTIVEEKYFNNTIHDVF